MQVEGFDKITLFDVETPNRHNDRLCSIAIVHWKDGQRMVAKEWLVNPEVNFDSFNVRLHGITPKKVAQAPNFSQLWSEIKVYFEESLVIAHNASFDISVLSKCLEAYGIEAPDFHYGCTVQMAKRRLSKQPFNLSALSATLGVPLLQHHNALSDTEACEGIFVHLLALKPMAKADYKYFGRKGLGQKTQAPWVFKSGTYQKVGKRGLLFSFMHIGMQTNVYAIEGQASIYIIDTYLGPDIMAEVDQVLHRLFGPKPKIIINTHHDWDHIWGNCRYGDHWIVAHSLCPERIRAAGPTQLLENGIAKGLAQGQVELVLPNLTFADRLTFERDQLYLWHTPGHTEDSISIWDALDGILIAGDNLEMPHPFIQWTTPTDINIINTYLETLKHYEDLPIKGIVNGHNPLADRTMLTANRQWLEQEHAKQ